VDIKADVQESVQRFVHEVPDEGWSYAIETPDQCTKDPRGRSAVRPHAATEAGNKATAIPTPEVDCIQGAEDQHAEPGSVGLLVATAAGAEPR